MFSLYLLTAILFLALDALVLKLILRPLFARNLGATIRDAPLVLPAAAFYLAYVAGLVWLVSGPATLAGNPREAALKGAILGAMAYGTRDFTSMSVMRGWSWSMAATGTIWGATVTGFCAWAGVAVMLRLS